MSTLFDTNTANRGGGIYNGKDGTLRIESNNYLFLKNRADLDGGAIYNDRGKIIISGSTYRFQPFKRRQFEGNSANSGAIYSNGGTLKIEMADVFRNEAFNGGNGAAITLTNNAEATISQDSFYDNSSSGRGGVIFDTKGATANVEQSRIYNNSANEGGGAVYADQKSILRLSNSTCENNKSRIGGCIYGNSADVMLSSVVCERNAALNGGCLRTGPIPGRLQILNTEIRSNSATSGSRGGGLLLENTQVDIKNSENAGNSAGMYGDGGIGSGGGIFGLTTDSAQPTDIIMISSTVAGNTASAKGAGIELDHFSGFTALNSTFAGEGPADVPEHGLHFVNSYANIISSTLAVAPLSVEGVVEGDLRNSLFVNSSRYCIGNIADGGHNMQFPAPFRVCSTTIPVLDPKLDPAGLKNNGGPTPTIGLTAASPAIDYVPRAECTDHNGALLLVDQRRFQRPDPEDGPNGPCDIGAFESQER